MYQKFGSFLRYFKTAKTKIFIFNNNFFQGGNALAEEVERLNERKSQLQKYNVRLEEENVRLKLEIEKLKLGSHNLDDL